MSAFKTGDRVHYTYVSLSRANRYLPPAGCLGTVQDGPFELEAATWVLFDGWLDPLRSVGNPQGAFLCDNDDLEKVP